MVTEQRQGERDQKEGMKKYEFIITFAQNLILQLVYYLLFEGSFLAERSIFHLFCELGKRMVVHLFALP